MIVHYPCIMIPYTFCLLLLHNFPLIASYSKAAHFLPFVYYSILHTTFMLLKHFPMLAFYFKTSHYLPTTIRFDIALPLLKDLIFVLNFHAILPKDLSILSYYYESAHYQMLLQDFKIHS